ncbi:MAG: hypothetical protein AB7Q97_06610 [Gammaproteobacteria bacterium]
MYNRQDSTWLIEITLRDVRQLFNNLDPSPFHDKDLDRDAETYLFEAVREIGIDEPIKVVIYLPEEAIDGPDALALPAAMHNYFATQGGNVRRDLRHLLRDGVVSLAIGLAFLLFCLSLRQVLGRTGGAPGEMLQEGLLIIGWVAMWRPLEIMLYDWWPIRRRQHVFARLAALPVELRSKR